MRINAVCSLIEPCGIFADVGCDHGMVAGYASKICGKVIAADVSEKAIVLLKEKFADKPNVICRVSDGFDLIPEPVDQAVIAGMGGRLIIKILSRYARRPDLIIGAQHDVSAVRVWLTENGYKIIADRCVYDRGKYYDVIRAVAGESEPLTEIERTIGVFYKQKNPDLLRFLTESEEKINGYKRTSGNDRRLALIKEALEWQR